jgi:gas vesicle protein
MSKGLNVLVAAIGGFVAGVLMAPKSGKETRED